jgi:hypothetical protein
MAKGQKRGNREAKKPKQPKAKPVLATSPFTAARAHAALLPAKKVESNDLYSGGRRHDATA